MRHLQPDVQVAAKYDVGDPYMYRGCKRRPYTPQAVAIADMAKCFMKAWGQGGRDQMVKE